MRSRSQCIFCASSLSVEVKFGRIIQRTTLPIVRGVVEDEETAERNWGIGTARERRRTVQTGILEVYFLYNSM